MQVMGRTEPPVCSCSSAAPNLDARAAVHVKGARFAGYGVPVGDDQSWRSGKLDETFAHSKAGLNLNVTPFL